MVGDRNLNRATAQIERAQADKRLRPSIAGFFDEATNTVSYVVHDPKTGEAAIIDSVLDFDAASGRTSNGSADRMIEYVTSNNLKVTWLVETHAHADHISAAPYLQERLGGKLAIGRDIIRVQEVFGKLFNAVAPFLGMGGGDGRNVEGQAGRIPHGGAPGGMAGEGGNLLDSVAGGFSNLAKAMGPVGFILAGTIVGLRKFVQWLGNVDKKSRKMIEDNRGLAQYSGSLAGSYAQLDNERLLREITKAQEMSGPLGRLTKSQSGFEASQENLLLPFKKVAVDIQAMLTNVASYVIDIAEMIDPIGELIKKFYGEELEKKAANNVVQFLAREANDRMAKRKLKR